MFQILAVAIVLLQCVSSQPRWKTVGKGGSRNGGPVTNCDDQADCIRIERKLLENGQYRVCLWWDDALEQCRKDGTISHACPGVSQSKIEGLAARVRMCNVVDCGSATSFGLKDGQTCSDGTGSYQVSGADDAYCVTAGSSSPVCPGGNQEECKWIVRTPDCPSETTTTTVAATTTTAAPTTTTAEPTTAAPTTAAPTTAAPTTAAPTTAAPTTAAPTTAAPTTAAPTTAAPTTAAPTESTTPVPCDYTPNCPIGAPMTECDIPGCGPGETGLCAQIWFGVDECELPEAQCVAHCGCEFLEGSCVPLSATNS